MMLVTGAVLSGLAAESSLPVMAAPSQRIAPAIKLPAGVVKAWSNPATQSIYTGPKDSDFVGELKDALKATPAGATVRAATYSISDMNVVKLFTDAKRRKVHVKFTSWTKAQKASPKQIGKLKRALGTNTEKSSYLKLCRGSCYISGSDSASQHAKIVTISSVINTKGKRVRDIVFITSANFSKAAVTRTWNHTQLIVGCSKIYKALTAYMDGMRHDKTKRNFRPVTACGYTLFLYPSAHLKNQAIETLKDVKCKATKSTKTVVRVMMYVWPSSQRVAAKQLAMLHKQGCNVRVIVTSGTTNKGNVGVMRKAGVTVYDAKVKDRYLHAKLVVISGRVGKKLVDQVITGSANFSVAAIRRNNETQLVIRGEAHVREALNFFDRVAKKSRRYK